MYYTTDANGNRVPAYEGGELANVEVVSAAKALTVEESGKLCILSAAAGAEITLPTELSTWKFKFRVGLAFATTDWTIVSATNVIQGYASVNYATVAASDENTISFVATAETIGDEITVECDGTNIWASGNGSLAGSITFTAP